MTERPAGFEKIIKECCSYDLTQDLINTLGAVTDLIEGYNVYSYTNFEDGKFVSHKVKFKDFNNGYKFTIDNKIGFIINENNYKSTFTKLIEIIPILFMLEFEHHDFYGYVLPLDTSSYLTQLMGYSKTYEGYANKMSLSKDGNTFIAHFMSNNNEEKLSFEVKDDGTATYVSKSKQYPGGIFLSDNYPLASTIMLENVKEFLRRNYFLMDDLMKLAPLK